MCGHGNYDLTAYQAYLDGKLEDYDYPVEMVEAAMVELPQIPG